MLPLAQRALRDFPAVVITGSRQVGKTTLAKELASAQRKRWTYLDLESPREMARLYDAESFFEAHQRELVVIDEVQRMPELFPVLRSAIDRERRMGRFLLLGSSSPAIVRRTAESLAGRVAYMDLMPLHVGEVGAAAAQRLWMRGGYPAVFLSRGARVAADRVGQMVRTFLERDLPQLGLTADPRTTHRLLQMVASVHGQVLNASLLAKSIGMTVHTVQRYLDFFEQAFLTFTLPSHHTNLRKRLTKAPKAYLLDSGVLHHLTGVNALDDLRGHALHGHSWEGFVIQQVRARYGDRAGTGYFRTHDGSELDLVVTQGLKAVAAVEIKSTNAPALSKGNQLAFAAVGTKLQLICTPGSEDYPYSRDKVVCSLSTLFDHLDKVMK